MIERMEKFLRSLTKIPNDKLLHFFYGSIIFYLALLLTNNMYYALTFISVLAFVKEVYDVVIPNHESSFMDFIYGVATGILYVTITYIQI